MRAKLTAAARRLARRFETTFEARRPTSWVGAFGKHPCATDHLTDLAGDAPPSLGEVASSLYFGGIRDALTAGRWGQLEAVGLAMPFGHVFAHRASRRPGHLVVGRLWASRDGVRPTPRGDFPMVAVAELSDFDAGRVAPALAALRRFETACRATQTREGVESALAMARREVEESKVADAPEPLRFDAGRHAVETPDPDAILARLIAGLPVAKDDVTPPDWWAFLPDAAGFADVLAGPTTPADFALLRDGRTPGSTPVPASADDSKADAR